MVIVHSNLLCNLVSQLYYITDYYITDSFELLFLSPQTIVLDSIIHPLCQAAP